MDGAGNMRSCNGPRSPALSTWGIIDLFRIARVFAFPGTAFPGYPHVLLPPSPRSPPPMAISPRSTVREIPGRTGHGFPPDIAMTAPAPGGGEEREAQAGGGCRRGTLGDILPGRGAPPRPHPRGDSHHGPLHGRSRGRTSSGSLPPSPEKPPPAPPPDTAFPWLSP